jgi:predicted AAA+ superfamily ATPase
MHYVPRVLTQTIRRAMSTFPAVLVTGARQTGKTTLLRTEFGDAYHYLSLERPDVRARALADPVAFLNEAGAPLMLDEIQYAPALLHYIKDRIDADRSPGRWLMTGSQSFALMHGVSQTLSRRVAVLTLDPLSTAEALEQPPASSLEAVLARVFDSQSASVPVDAARAIDFADWLLRGGFPEPRVNRQVDRQLWWASYVQTYLERDVRDLAQVADLGAFGRFLMLVGAHTGRIINMTDFGREVGVSGPTVKRWLSVLETSQIVYLLQPYYRNFGKRIRKSPKLYLLDPGLATFLLGLHTPEAVLQGPSLGALAETAVVGEWIKACHQTGEQPLLYYWQLSTGAEVDLIIDRGGVLYGIEVKATATPTPRHADGLARWLELTGPGARGALACRVEQPQALRPGIRAIPWHLAW